MDNNSEQTHKNEQETSGLPLPKMDKERFERYKRGEAMFLTPEEAAYIDERLGTPREIAPEEEKALIGAIEQARKKREELFTKVMDVPDVDWIVEAVAVRDGITLLFGDSGIGKTSLMLQLMGCVAEWKEFCGLQTKTVKTLLIEQDEGIPLLQSHIEKMLPIYPSLKQLEVPKAPVIWDNRTADFEGKGKLFHELIDYSWASIVIIDSLTSLGIADINHPSSAIIFDKLRQLADKHQCAFILLHHPNRSGDVMGSNLIKAKVDCLLELQKGKLIFCKLRGGTPKSAIVKAGNHPYLEIEQNRDTLIFSPDRGAFIRKLWQQGKSKAVIIESVCKEYGLKREAARKAVERETKPKQEANK